MGIVQDTLRSARLFTLRDTFIEKPLLMHLLMFVPKWDGKIPVPAIVKPKPLWTGKQLFSMLIDDRVNLDRTHSKHDSKEDNSPNWHITAHDTRVMIRSGVLLSGIICKNTLGPKAAGLLHITRLECGSDICRRLFGGIQTLCNNWLTFEGASIGIEDAIADPVTSRKIRKVLEQSVEKVTPPPHTHTHKHTHTHHHHHHHCRHRRTHTSERANDPFFSPINSSIHHPHT
jgi:DNA-directed RNA polymerase II subunit RPB1